LTISIITLATIYDPEFTHDVIYYSAIVNHQNGLDGSYEGTRSYLDQRMPAEKLRDFNAEHRYPTDPAYFYAVLPFFAVKTGFIKAIQVVSMVSDPITAMLLVNCISVLASIMILFAVFRQIDGAFSFLWLPVIGLLNFDMHGREFTPNALNTLVYCAGFLPLIRQRYWSAAILLIIPVFVRPDGVVLNAFLAVAFFPYISRSAGAVLLLGSAAAYFVATKTSGHPGWWVHFYHTMIDQYAIAKGATPSFSLTLYLKALVVGCVEIFLKGTWIPPVILTILICHFRTRSRAADILFRLALVALLAIVAKVIVFPTPQNRSTIPSILLLAFCAAALIRMRVARPETANRAAPG